MEIYTSADGTSRRDAIGKLSQFLGATSGWALLSLLLSTSTWNRSHDGCEAVTWVGLGGLEPPTSSLSGIIGHSRYVLRPRSAGLPVCPRVAVRIPD